MKPSQSPPENPVVTCVYCGHTYPEGTPTHQAELLTAHIKVCEKHPLREAEEKISKLRKALGDLVGAHDPTELDAMEGVIRLMRAPEADKISALNAIHALRETAPEP